MTRNHPFKPSEDAYIRKHWLSMHTAEIGRAIGRTNNSIIGRAKRLGLPRIERSVAAARGAATRAALLRGEPIAVGRPKYEQALAPIRPRQPCSVCGKGFVNVEAHLAAHSAEERAATIFLAEAKRADARRQQFRQGRRL